MLAAQDLTYEVSRRALVSDVSLALMPGRLTVVIGPNGAGKSTLFRLLTGELRPTRGRVLIDGRDMRMVSPALLAGRRAVVPQSSVLAFPFTVLEAVLLGAYVPGFGLPRERALDLACGALAAVGLHGFQGRLFTQLSGGEKQRVAFARALCQLNAAGTAGRRALLLDEPTASLDIAHQRIVLDETQREARRGSTVLVILHDLNLASAYADEMVLMSDGRIVASGEPTAVLEGTLLSEVYGCPVRIGRTAEGRPFLLPFGASRSPADPVGSQRPTA